MDNCMDELIKVTDFCIDIYCCVRVILPTISLTHNTLRAVNLKGIWPRRAPKA